MPNYLSFLVLISSSLLALFFAPVDGITYKPLSANSVYLSSGLRQARRDHFAYDCLQHRQNGWFRHQAESLNNEWCRVSPKLLFEGVALPPSVVEVRKKALLNYTSYEKQLEQEFIEQLTGRKKLNQIYEKAAEFFIFLEVIDQAIVLGRQAKNDRDFTAATYWANTGWQALSIAKAVGEGIVQGLYRNLEFGVHAVAWATNTATHPLQSLQGLANHINTVLSFFSKHRHYFRFHDPTVLAQDFALLSTAVEKLVRDCTHQLNGMSAQEKVTYVTAFGTEILAPTQFFKIGKLIGSRLKPLTVLLAKAAQREKAVVEIAGLGKETILLQEAVAQTAPTVVPKIVEKVRKTLIPVWVDVEKLRKKFENRVIYLGKQVLIDIEHLFSIEELKPKRRSGNYMKPKLSGWHHDYGRRLEKASIVNYTNVIEGLEGSFLAMPIIKGIEYPRKTFFSPLWTEEKVIEKIYEAFDEIKPLIKDVSIDPGGYKVLKGTTKEGLKIKIIFDTKKSMITSAFPLIE